MSEVEDAAFAKLETLPNIYQIEKTKMKKNNVG